MMITYHMIYAIFAEIKANAEKNGFTVVLFLAKHLL